MELEERVKRIERKLFGVEEYTSSQLPLRKEWTSFETDLLEEDLNTILLNRTLQFGRSRNSLVWKMCRILQAWRI